MFCNRAYVRSRAEYFFARLSSALMLSGAAFLPSLASADTGINAKIELLQNYQTHSGLLVRMAATMPDPDGCGRTDWYILPDTTPRVALVQSMLLTARAGSATVTVVIGGCQDGMPKIIHVTF
jgi:hypothetical protein